MTVTSIRRTFLRNEAKYSIPTSNLSSTVRKNFHFYSIDAFSTFLARKQGLIRKKKRRDNYECEQLRLNRQFII